MSEDRHGFSAAGAAAGEDGDLSARLSIGFSNIGHSFSHLFMMLYPTVVLVLGPVFNMPYGELLSLSLPGFVLFGLGALPAGWLSDKWSAPAMMVVFFLGTGGASIATGFAGSPLAISIGLGVIGLFAAIYHPVGMAWVVANAKRRGRALGFNGVFGSVGFALASVVAGVLTDAINWRAAFIVPGIVGVGTGLALWAVMARGLVRETGADRAADPVQPVAGDRRRTFYLLSLTMICGGLIFQAGSVSLPKLFDVRLFDGTGDVAAASSLVTLVFLVAAGGQLLGGTLADRLGSKPVYVTTFSLQVLLILVVGMASGSFLVVAAAAMIFANVGGLPAENALLARYTPREWRATAFGAKFILSLGISAAAIPLVALLHEMTGDFGAVYGILCGLAVIAVIGALMLPKEGGVPQRGRSSLRDPVIEGENADLPPPHGAVGAAAPPAGE